MTRGTSLLKGSAEESTTDATQTNRLQIYIYKILRFFRYDILCAPQPPVKRLTCTLTLNICRQSRSLNSCGARSRVRLFKTKAALSEKRGFAFCPLRCFRDTAFWPARDRSLRGKRRVIGVYRPHLSYTPLFADEWLVNLTPSDSILLGDVLGLLVHDVVLPFAK